MASAPTDPIARFRAMLTRAMEIDRERLPEPTAFVLATSTPDGRPSARVVLLKSVDETGFVFYTNHESRKGRELHANPHAALCFHWQPLEIQVRVEGSVAPVEPHEADAYFASRARGSQLGAWASRQSQVLAHDRELEERLAEAERRYQGANVPRPPHWSGFRVTPERIEFWKNKPSRLHERELYEWQGETWVIRVLHP